MPNPILENIRRSLERSGQSGSIPLPTVLPARQAGEFDAETGLFMEELRKIGGAAQCLPAGGVSEALRMLVGTEAIHKAVLWRTPGLLELHIPEILEETGVTLVPAGAAPSSLAECDLGITEADFALPETGSLGLFSSPEKPRAVSLLPRIHLAIVRPQAFRPDLHQVFAEARRQPYLVLITGPSRTSDIELTLTLGVHGPQKLVAWIIEEE